MSFTADDARAYLEGRARREAQRECSDCGAVDPPTIAVDAMGGERVVVHAGCPTTRDDGRLPTLWERSVPLLGADECRAACEAVVALTERLGALHAAARAVAAAQLDHDRDPSDATRAALDVALTALFALVPAEVTSDAPTPPRAPAVQAPDGGGTGEGGPAATAVAAEAVALATLAALELDPLRAEVARLTAELDTERARNAPLRALVASMESSRAITRRIVSSATGQGAAETVSALDEARRDAATWNARATEMEAERDMRWAQVQEQATALRVVALWLGGPHHSSQPDDVATLARAKASELDATRAAVVEHLAADASLTDAFESARSISANSSVLDEVMAAWKAHSAAVDRAQKALAALRALLPKAGAAEGSA